MGEKDQLAHLRGMKDNWNGYGSAAPNETALANAEMFLSVLDGIKPNRIVPSAEDGVCVCFIEGGRYAEVEIFNTGTVLAINKLIPARPDSLLTIWRVDPSKTSFSRVIEEFEQFLFETPSGVFVGDAGTKNNISFPRESEEN